MNMPIQPPRTPSIARFSGLALAAVIPAVFFLFAQPAHAATYTWDPTFSPASPAGGTGTWILSGTGWSNGAVDSPWTDAAGTSDTAVFAGSAGTVTVSGTVGALGLQFLTTGYTLT